MNRATKIIALVCMVKYLNLSNNLILNLILLTLLDVALESLVALISYFIGN